MPRPKITIITCTYNSSRYLRETLNSVKEQTFKDFEHLFVDGGSTDDTLTIIKEYYNNAAIIIGKDKGLYDAFNKGLARANGQIIGFLHSDDIFFDNQALERVSSAFMNKDVDYYCARMVIYDEKLESLFAILGAPPHRQTLKDQLYSSTYFAHPTYYCKKEIIEQVGDFDLAYKVAADIDWLYRLENTTQQFYFDPKPLVKFRGEGGISANKYFVALSEEMSIRIKNEERSLDLYFIYYYHFFRRGIRFILERLGLLKAIGLLRKMIFKLKTN